MTTIRECTMQICREIGMSEDELERFIKDQDVNATPEALEEVNTKTIEELGPMSDFFWLAMRHDVPVLVNKWREATKDHTNFAE